MKELSELTHRCHLAGWLQASGLRGWGAEIGVAEGQFAGTLLSTWQCKGLHLVDLWQPGAGSGQSTEQMSQDEHDRRYFACRKALAPFGERAVYHRTWSHIASTEIQDGSLDFIYIDGSHLYPWVVLDLHLWYPKLRINGLFSGHDYNAPGPGNGARIAVDEFAARLGTPITVIQEHPTSAVWAFVKKRQLPGEVT